MLAVIPTIHDHIALVPSDEQDPVQVAAMARHVYAHEGEIEQWAVSLVRGSTLLGVMGFRPLWPGVAEAWAFLSDEVRALPVFLTRSASRWLVEGTDRLGLVRIQALTPVEDERAQRWLRTLRFKNEGLLRSYGVGGKGDFMMLARIF